MSKNILYSQVIPAGCSFLLLFSLVLVLLGEIRILNIFTLNPILTDIRWPDVFVGVTIYLKTSIDFALFIGNLMQKNPGWKQRIAIESGTAVGNAVGTLAVLAVWIFFKDIRILLACMVSLASFVLLQMAQGGLEHAKNPYASKESLYYRCIVGIELILHRINAFTEPILSRIIPHSSINAVVASSWTDLFIKSFTIPFILGLDDFAGYVPLFSVVNVFGFAIGVMAGHTILNIFLFLHPKKTIDIVQNTIVSFIGSLAFIGLGVWGVWESIHLLLGK